jgi:H+/gluconate symporter-like permease
LANVKPSWYFFIGAGIIILALMAGFGSWVKWLLVIIGLGLVIGQWTNITGSFTTIRNKGIV